MNRSEFLSRALLTWTALREVDEIVIVDWSSDPPVADQLADVLSLWHDPRVKIVRVTDQQHWLHSACHNLEWKIASGHWLLRLDSDNLLHPTFLEHHPLRPNTFWTGNWRTVPPDQDDKRNLTGILLAPRSALAAVNGYNERLVNYGHEDDDLYERLKTAGLEKLDVDLALADHIPHPDRKRYENLAIRGHVETLVKARQLQSGSTDDGLAYTPERQMLVNHEADCCRRHPWSACDRLSRWWLSPFKRSGNGAPVATCEPYELGASQDRRSLGWKLL